MDSHINKPTPCVRLRCQVSAINTRKVASSFRLVRWRWDFNWLLQWVTEPLRFFSPLPHRRPWLAFWPIYLRCFLIMSGKQWCVARSPRHERHYSCQLLNKVSFKQLTVILYYNQLCVASSTEQLHLMKWTWWPLCRGQTAPLKLYQRGFIKCLPAWSSLGEAILDFYTLIPINVK